MHVSRKSPGVVFTVKVDGTAVLAHTLLVSMAIIGLISHACTAFVLVGSTTHHGWLCMRSILGRAELHKLQRKYATVIVWSFALTFIQGLLIYPTFRVNVRAAWLDANVPLATGFFEIKEHFLAMGLLLAATIYGARFRAEPTALFRMCLNVLGILLMLIVWFATITGLVLTIIRPM